MHDYPEPIIIQAVGQEANHMAETHAETAEAADLQKLNLHESIEFSRMM